MSYFNQYSEPDIIRKIREMLPQAVSLVDYVANYNCSSYNEELIITFRTQHGTRLFNFQITSRDRDILSDVMRQLHDCSYGLNTTITPSANELIIRNDGNVGIGIINPGTTFSSPKKYKKDIEFKQPIKDNNLLLLL